MLSWEKTATETPNGLVDNLGILQIIHEGTKNSLLYFSSNEPWEATALWFPRSNSPVCTYRSLPWLNSWSRNKDLSPTGFLPEERQEREEDHGLNACSQLWSWLCVIPTGRMTLLCCVTHPSPVAGSSNQRIQGTFHHFNLYFLYLSIYCSGNGTKPGKFREQKGTRKVTLREKLSLVSNACFQNALLTRSGKNSCLPHLRQDMGNHCSCSVLQQAHTLKRMGC